MAVVKRAANDGSIGVDHFDQTAVRDFVAGLFNQALEDPWVQKAPGGAHADDGQLVVWRGPCAHALVPISSPFLWEVPRMKPGGASLRAGKTQCQNPDHSL